MPTAGPNAAFAAMTHLLGQRLDPYGSFHFLVEIEGILAGGFSECHGLSVEMTEALEEYWHRRIREEWGFADEDGPTLSGLFRQQYRGSRYSWGYPACPDLEDQTKLDELLDLSSIGVQLTEEFQLEPEQTTSAIIVPHPEAKYFIA